MGCKYHSKNLIFIIIIGIIIFSFISCGEFIGFSDIPEPDIGNVLKIKLYLTQNSLLKLYESVSERDYVPCIYEENGKRTEALIKVRGFTSRMDPKKSFTININTKDGILKYALETAYDSFVRNRLAMFAYKQAGLYAPNTTGTGLYINNEYIGYYTRIEMYNQKNLKSNYYNTSAELFKIFFWDMGNDIPINSWCEKKFPDNNDYTSLNTLILNSKNMTDSEWVNWTANYIDTDEIVKYLVVHYYLAVYDTGYLNFYIYNYGKFLLLPWDNEACMNINKNGYRAGNSILTKRLLTIPAIKTLYNNELNRLFLTDEADINPSLDLANPLSTDNLIDDLMVETNRIYNNVDRAVYYEPSDYVTYTEFINEKNMVNNFLNNRSYRIPDPALP